MENARNFLQLLLYPLTLGVAGYIFNSHLDNTRKTEVMEKFIPRLTGDAPEDAFLADRLIDRLLDKATANEVHRITRETWKARLHKAVKDGKVEDARRIAETANLYGGEIGKEVLRDAQAPNAQVLAGYDQPSQVGNGPAAKLDPTKNLGPEQVSKQVLAAATIAPEIQQASLKGAASPVAQTPQFNWIYLGSTTNKKWLTKNFVENVSPDQMKGETITPSTEIFRRADLPKFTNGEWKLGNIVGVLPGQQRVPVQDIRAVPGVKNTELWWAWVPAP